MSYYLTSKVASYRSIMWLCDDLSRIWFLKEKNNPSISFWKKIQIINYYQEDLTLNVVVCLEFKWMEELTCCKFFFSSLYYESMSQGINKISLVYKDTSFSYPSPNCLARSNILVASLHRRWPLTIVVGLNLRSFS